MRKIIRKLCKRFMRTYKPSFTIINEILSNASLISEKIGRITATGNLEAKPT